jgi:hypothetical protein
MPLKKGKSKKVISQNISEFHKGKKYAATKRKFGKKRADDQAIAAAMRSAGKSRRVGRTRR